jgi:hypothetical protein
MAKYLKSPLLPRLRGKAGGTVFSENRYGPYMAVKSMPVYRESPALSRSRSTMSSLSQKWSWDLSDAQYEAWANYVKKLKLKDSSGNIYNPAPRDIFISYNFNLRSVGMPFILDHPKDKTLQKVGKFTFTAFADNRNLEFIDFFFAPELNKDTCILIFATHLLRNSINYYKDTWFRKIGYINDSFKSGDSILKLYSSVFRTQDIVPPNFKIAFRLKVISANTGISSPIVETALSFRA